MTPILMGGSSARTADTVPVVSAVARSEPAKIMRAERPVHKSGLFNILDPSRFLIQRHQPAGWITPGPGQLQYSDSNHVNAL
jgi:hypothetical protein